MLHKTEMRIIRMINRKKLLYTLRNDLRERCEIQNLTTRIRHRRKNCNKYIERMDDSRLAKKAKNNILVGKIQ